MNACEFGPNRAAPIFPSYTRSHQPSHSQGWHVKCRRGGCGCEHRISQKAIELGARKWPAVPKGCCFELRPQAGAIGNNENDAARRHQDAPNLTQQRAQGFRIFKEM